MIQKPTPPDYVTIYWLAIEATGSHAQAVEAIKQAEEDYNQAMITWIKEMSK